MWCSKLAAQVLFNSFTVKWQYEQSRKTSWFGMLIIFLLHWLCTMMEKAVSRRRSPQTKIRALVDESLTRGKNDIKGTPAISMSICTYTSEGILKFSFSLFLCLFIFKKTNCIIFSSKFEIYNIFSKAFSHVIKYPLK